jgi:hypothetical protein
MFSPSSNTDTYHYRSIQAMQGKARSLTLPGVGGEVNDAPEEEQPSLQSSCGLDEDGSFCIDDFLDLEDFCDVGKEGGYDIPEQASDVIAAKQEESGPSCDRFNPSPHTDQLTDMPVSFCPLNQWMFKV